VIRSRFEVCFDDLGDLLGAALGDDRVEQPVGSSVGEVVFFKAEPQEVPGVVGQAQVVLRVVAGDVLCPRGIAFDDAGELGGEQLAGAEAFAGLADASRPSRKVRIVARGLRYALVASECPMPMPSRNRAGNSARTCAAADAVSPGS
jgi:hypothetical protein